MLLLSDHQQTEGIWLQCPVEQDQMLQTDPEPSLAHLFICWTELDLSCSSVSIHNSKGRNSVFITNFYCKFVVCVHWFNDVICFFLRCWTWLIEEKDLHAKWTQKLFWSMGKFYFGFGWFAYRLRYGWRECIYGLTLQKSLHWLLFIQYHGSY